MLNSFTRTQGFGSAPVTIQGWDIHARFNTADVHRGSPTAACSLITSCLYPGNRTAVSDRPLLRPGAPVIDVEPGAAISTGTVRQLPAYPNHQAGRAGGRVAYVRALRSVDIRGLASNRAAAVKGQGRSVDQAPGFARRGLSGASRGDRGRWSPGFKHARAGAELRCCDLYVVRTG